MKRIGRYIVHGLLGRGGMGKVFKVRLPIINKTFALKILDPNPLTADLMGMKKLRTLFIHEAVTMAGLNHPNIVSISDFDEHDAKPFFVMDYYPNNLGNMMGEQYFVETPSRRLVVDKALDYILQVLNGLDCLHDAGIVHRDIKPFNLLVTEQNIVKICDFGLSKLRSESFTGPANLNLGSPYYAAPELESDPDNVDGRTDLFSLGIMLYRMLTGRLPYLNGVQAGHPPASDLHPDLDAIWDNFFDRALARQRESRFTNADAMKTAVIELQYHWQQKKEKSCSQSDLLAETERSLKPQAPTTIRFAPGKFRPRQVSTLLDLDVLWQPRRHTRPHFVQESSQTIKDGTTDLIWQLSGSRYPCTWHQAHRYVECLNQTIYGGFRNWRLPTIEELITLITHTSHGADLCIEPIFDRSQRWIWSSDRRSYVAAYYLDVELGFVGWQDFTVAYYVRAVNSGRL